MCRSVKSAFALLILLGAALMAGAGCWKGDNVADNESPAQIVYVTTPDQCLSCTHAWQLFECVRAHDRLAKVRLVALLLCERQIEASGWRYSSVVDTVVVSTPNKPSQLYSKLSGLGDYQLFVLSGEKTLGYWKASALTDQVCDSVLHLIERAQE